MYAVETHRHRGARPSPQRFVLHKWWRLMEPENREVFVPVWMIILCAIRFGLWGAWLGLYFPGLGFQFVVAKRLLGLNSGDPLNIKRGAVIFLGENLKIASVYRGSATMRQCSGQRWARLLFLFHLWNKHFTLWHTPMYHWQPIYIDIDCIYICINYKFKNAVLTNSDCLMSWFSYHFLMNNTVSPGNSSILYEYEYWNKKDFIFAPYQIFFKRCINGEKTNKIINKTRLRCWWLREVVIWATH